MKKLFIGITTVLVIGVSTVYLGNKSRESPEVKNDVISPFYADIYLSVLATGRIVPRNEVAIKTQVSGIIDELHVKPGDHIEEGGLIASITVVPDLQLLNDGEAQLAQADINLKNAEREFYKQKNLFGRNLISDTTFSEALLKFNLSKESVESAHNKVDLTKRGFTKNNDKVANLVRATTRGTVLDIPVKHGFYVTQTNTFNDGTTVAYVANMDDLIFEGSVDESEVGRLKVGMLMTLDAAAAKGQKFDAKLELISSKGFWDKGTMKYKIEAKIVPREDIILRSGYSAISKIILDKRHHALSLNESNITYEGTERFVYVLDADGQAKKRKIETGLSDGINIEVLSGIQQSDKIKKI